MYPFGLVWFGWTVEVTNNRLGGTEDFWDFILKGQDVLVPDTIVSGTDNEGDVMRVEEVFRLRVRVR